MRLVDTHAHLHSKDYKLDPDEVIAQAKAVGVEKILCVGTDEKDSALAVEFVQERQTCFASVGLHPHDAGKQVFEKIATLVSKPKVIAVGECGFDFYYNNSPKADQEQVFRWHIVLALEQDLPLIFHVREAFDDFFKVVDKYSGLRGVVHSFSATEQELEGVLSRGFYVGFNGIMTFSKDPKQLEAAKQAPLDRIVLETDAPFLTPEPKRGTVNESSNVRLVAEFLAKLRGEDPDQLAEVTSQNACSLFNI